MGHRRGLGRAASAPTGRDRIGHAEPARRHGQGEVQPQVQQDREQQRRARLHAAILPNAHRRDPGDGHELPGSLDLTQEAARPCGERSH